MKIVNLEKTDKKDRDIDDNTLHKLFFKGAPQRIISETVFSQASQPMKAPKASVGT